MRMPTPALSHPFRGWLLLALAGLALLLVASRVQAQSDWTPCADEDSVCRFSGEAMVRFGVAEHYAFRLARNRVLCDIEEFGDPAPNQRKSCSVSLRWRTDPRYQGWRDTAGTPASQTGNRWRACAAEGDTCVLEAPARVRFGAEGRFQTRAITGRVQCAVSQFGDPAPGVAKRCEVEDSEDWVLCAHEGESCRLPAQARVRYGANNRYQRRNANGSVACTNAVFGDPAPGTAKQCEYAVAGSAGVAAASAGSVGSEAGWQACARENGNCSFSGLALVRYGVAGRQVYREARDGLACNNASFGGDPAPEQPKQCEVWRQTR